MVKMTPAQGWLSDILRLPFQEQGGTAAETTHNKEKDAHWAEEKASHEKSGDVSGMMHKFLQDSKRMVLEEKNHVSRVQGTQWPEDEASNRSNGIEDADFLINIEASLRWAELELVTIALRNKEDIDEIAFWRYATDAEVAKARKHLREMSKRINGAAHEDDESGAPTLAKCVPSDDMCDATPPNYLGSLARMELEATVSDLRIALERERRRAADLEGRLAAAQAQHKRELTERCTDVDGMCDEGVREEVIRARRERQEMAEELSAARELLKRRNKEQARDGRTIAELSEWCEKLQARLTEATIKDHHRGNDEQHAGSEHKQHPHEGDQQDSAGRVAAATLCKTLPSSHRSDVPQLAKKLPSPSSSHRLVSGERPTSAARSGAPGVVSIAVTRPKEPSWFDGASGWLGKTTTSTPTHGSDVRGARDVASGSWFGAANPLDKLGETLKQGMMRRDEPAG